ncbi:MAG: hypothetical protein H6645_05395 [Caldilineaceae bacterium]|nr:hypothetical protein [Caldilineaceae bacterium]
MRRLKAAPALLDFSDQLNHCDAASGRAVSTCSFSVAGPLPWAREPGFDLDRVGHPLIPKTERNFVGRMAGEFCGSGPKATEVE